MRKCVCFCVTYLVYMCARVSVGDACECVCLHVCVCV